MLTSIIELFNKAGKDKLEFKPAIRVKTDSQVKPVWIDRMYKIRDQYMVTISDADNESMNMNVAAIDNSFLGSLHKKLTILIGK